MKLGSFRITSLQSVSLNVNEGEFVCLVRRNGAGKSSIKKSIIGLYSSRSGKITFKDKDITKLSSRDRALMGLGYSTE